MKKDLLSLTDLTPQEILELCTLAKDLKAKKGNRLDILKGKSIGLLFQKPSNRTRVSFEVGIWQLGGNCIYLAPGEISLGKRESASDVAQTLSRYLDGLVARTNTHEDIIALGKNATVPIINGLSDLYHPCQALADIFSIQEKFGQLENLTVAYIGDGNNVCHSLLLACAMTGVHIRMASPRGYEPSKDVIAQAQQYAQQNGSEIMVTTDAPDAVKGANVVYTDVWTSMGQEAETKKRLKIFKKYQINAALMKEAAVDHIFMHCLPAHRGQEVTDEIIDGPHSIVFDQAENRMHIQKAVLAFLLQA